MPYQSKQKLLICTQAVDRNDPYLGFFHSWIEELSKHHVQVVVLCLRVGEYSLPAHVRVVSLGVGRVRRAWRLLRHSAALHGQYDTVFVHMSQEFILVGGWLWRALGKKIFLWRNHYSGGPLTRAAALFCEKVFYTSRYSYTARFKRSVQMPVGAEVGAPLPVSRRDGSVLFFGRLAPSKRPEVLLEALARMSNPPEAMLCGPGEESYIESLKLRAQEKGVRVIFKPGIPHAQVPEMFASFDCYVNAALSGMFDKTIFEAAAVGCVPISSSKDWQEQFPELYFEGSEALAQRLAWYVAVPPGEKEVLRGRLRAAAQSNSLKVLAERLAWEMEYHTH